MDWLYKLFCCGCNKKPTHQRGNTVIDIHEALKGERVTPNPTQRVTLKESMVVEYSSRKDRPCDKGLVRSKTVPILSYEQMASLRKS